MMSRDNTDVLASRRLQRRSRAGAFVRCNSGVSAVEFALFLPILIFSFLATVDIGLALYERMTIDHVLRAGSESAMADQGNASVDSVLAATAAASLPATKGLVLSPSNRFFACAESPDASVSSTATCAGGKPTGIFYRLSATKPYDGVFLPITIGHFKLLRFDLSSATTVQVR